MTTYSYGELETLWIDAGGPKALAPLMAAIAMAESSGNSQAFNPSGATGLWQILGAVDAADQSQLYDPKVNAKEAVLKYKSQGLGAWTTYTSGAYQPFYKGGVPAAQLPQGGTPASTPASTSQPTTDDTAAVAHVSGILAEAGTLVHDAAEALNWFFEFTKPGQGWRLVMGAAAVGGGYGALRMYQSPSAGSTASAEAPLAVVLTGASLVAGYMALRPWPVTGGRPIRPAPYVYEIFGGHAPAPGPAPGNDTQVLEVGLWALLGIWAASKTASSLSNAAKGIGGILGAVGGILKVLKSLGGKATTAAEEAGAVAGEAAAGA